MNDPITYTVSGISGFVGVMTSLSYQHCPVQKSIVGKYGLAVEFDVSRCQPL